MPVFSKLKEIFGPENFQEYLKQKVTIVPGDLLQENLGLSQEVYDDLTKNLHYVINGAASVEFNPPLEESLDINCLGTLRMFELAKNCQNLENFVHVSTCYVNSNNQGGFIEETVYDDPKQGYDPEETLQELLNTSKDQLQKNVDKIVGNYPNTYCYTKSLTERILKKYKKKHPNMTITILRPSIVGAAIDNDPYKGWVEGFNAANGIFIMLGLGGLYHIPCPYYGIADIVPVDLVSNYILLAAHQFAGSKEFNVCHASTSNGKIPLIWGYCEGLLTTYWNHYRSKRRIRESVIKRVDTTKEAKFGHNLTQVIPAKVFQKGAAVFGSKKT